jgi:F-type H+-transporting ATPase subunit gamma
VILFNTTEQPLYTLPQIVASDKLDAYEVEDDVLQSLQEFSFANTIYATMAEGYAAETAAKMSAMDNATRNAGRRRDRRPCGPAGSRVARAGDLIGKLTIVYNRSRQAAITTELVRGPLPRRLRAPGV